MSKHLKATIVNALIFGVLIALWDLLIDRSSRYILSHTLFMTAGYGVIMYFKDLLPGFFK